MEVYQALVAVEPFTLVVTILNLFLQIFLVKKFLLDKVMKVLDQRRSDADKEITDAEQAKAEAFAIKQTYEENMRQAQTEAGAILEQARKTADSRSEEIIRSAQAQAVQIRQKASRDIAQEKKKAINEAKNEISDIAMAVAGKVVGRSLDAADQTRLVDEFIAELGEGL